VNVAGGYREFDPPLAVASLPTPAALLDRDALESNMARVATAAAARGITLRPHVKTHKAPWIAARQVAHGAVGFTVATLDETELLVSAGIDDVFHCYPAAGAPRIARLVDLAQRASVRALVEDEQGARRLDAAARDAGLVLDVAIDVDTGLGRIGVALGEPLERLAAVTERLPALRLVALSTHEGFAYAIAEPIERARVVHERLEAFVAAGRSLAVGTISCGATPGIDAALDTPGITELRPGNYVFFDAMQVALGAAAIESCALTVLTTVVSVRSHDRAIVDSGSKALSSDAGVHGLGLLEGYGIVSGRPDLAVSGLSEEHGWVARVADGPPLRVGELLRIVPNHSCATVANFAALQLVENDHAVGRVAVGARGFAGSAVRR
jgi:D-serine deaminase-like pyridoxal phosphate-dependent protein